MFGSNDFGGCGCGSCSPKLEVEFTFKGKVGNTTFNVKGAILPDGTLQVSGTATTVTHVASLIDLSGGFVQHVGDVIDIKTVEVDAAVDLPLLLALLRYDSELRRHALESNRRLAA